MKQLLVFCSAALITNVAQTQPTLTAATNTPVVGTSFAVNFGPYVQPGSAGPNRTWDLSSLSIDSSLTAQYISATNTTNGVQFPTATIAEVNDLVTQYYRVANDGIHFAGSDDGTSVIVHTPQGTYLPLPCTFGITWSSPQNATFMVDEIEVTRTGTFSGQVDGYGDLVMPGVTIPNVLRVHWTHALVDDLGFFSMEQTYESYAFFVGGQAWPIAELVTSTIDFGGGPTTQQFSRWSGDLSTGITTSERETLHVFPNPARDEVYIAWPNGLGSRAAVFVMDMAGRSVILDRHTIQPGTTARVDIRSVNPGRYQLIVVGENGERMTAPISVH